MSLTAPRVPPWRWPALLRHLRAAGLVAPHPPPDTLYVDALAVEPDLRRRGVATTLLARAEEAAAAAGLSGVTLDTGLHNDAARALYEAHGLPHARDPASAQRRGRGRGRRPRLHRLLQARVTAISASATRATWPSVISGKNGSATDRAATSSQTGNSPSRWPKRSR